MGVILVIDEHDTTDHTRYVNTLTDLRRHRVVAHVPTTQADLGAELLRALGKTEHLIDEPPRATPINDRDLASRWIRAAHRLDLILYGAWRLSPRQLSWLTDLADSPGARLWLITHRGAANMKLLVRASSAVWSFKQFRDAQQRARPPRARRRRRRPEAAARAVLQPWPWFLPAAMVRSDDADRTELVRQPVLRDLPDQPTPSRIAGLLLEQLTRFDDDHRRAMLLLVAQDDLFHQGIWMTFDTHEILDACRNAHTATTRPLARDLQRLKAPEDALSLLMFELGLLVEATACLVGPRGAYIVNPAGRRVNVPAPLRQILRAATPEAPTEPWLQPTSGPLQQLHQKAATASADSIARIAHAIHLDHLPRAPARTTAIRSFTRWERPLRDYAAAPSDAAAVGAYLAETGSPHQPTDIAVMLGWNSERLENALSTLKTVAPTIGLRLLRIDPNFIRLGADRHAVQFLPNTRDRGRPLELHEVRMIYWIARRQMAAGRKRLVRLKEIDDYAQTPEERDAIRQLERLRLLEISDKRHIDLVPWLDRYLRGKSVDALDWSQALA